MYPYLKRILLTSVLLAMYLAGEAQQSAREQYIETFREIAVREMHRTGIPASIKLAQGILESGDGRSDLATDANNHFGIKCGGNWTGETFFKEDDDYVDGRLIKSCFRVFANAEESYIAHSEFLLDPTKDFRYGPLFQLRQDDYRAWARGLRTAGYATNPQYDRILIRIIEENGLYRYDKMTLADLPPSAPPIVGEPAQPKPADTKVSIKDATVTAGTYQQFTPGSQVQINRLPAVIARSGDTPLSISGRYRPSARRIARWNECQRENEVFVEGQPVFLKNKRRRYTGDQDFHMVTEGQTMYEISQIYGIRLDELYSKNRMIMGRQPAPGALIALKRRVDYTPELIPMRPWSREELGLEPVRPVQPVQEPARQPQQQPETRQPQAPIQQETTLIPEPEAAPQTSVHRVAAGETLFSIARSYQMTVQQLMEMNGLSDANIRIGQELRVLKRDH